MRRTLVLTCALLAGAALLAGCGGSSKRSSATVSTPVTTPTAATTTTPPATTPTQTATGQTTTQAGQPICRAADLKLSYLGGQGATGHGELGFALRNTSAATCATVGFPGVLFLDQAGQPLPTVPMHTTHDFFGSAPKAFLTVEPGASVSFRLGVTHGMTSTVGCTTAYALQVIPPNDTGTLRVSISYGAYECRTATVSPVRPGMSAYP